MVRHKNGWICMVCNRTGATDEHNIARSTPPEPRNPEDRLLDELQILRAALERVGLAPSHRRSIRARIENLEEQIGEWIPTSYKPAPNLKGGIG